MSRTELIIEARRAVHGGPVVEVRAGLVGVVVVLVNIVIDVDAVLVEVVVHIQEVMSIFELVVIVVGDGSERVHQIRVYLPRLRHVLEHLLLRLRHIPLTVWLVPVLIR